MEIQIRNNDKTNPLTFNNPPKDILTCIFKDIQYAGDLVALASVNKHYNRIFKSLLPQDYLRMIPSYIINARDPAIHRLPGWKKIQLAVTVEKKFIISKSF